MNKTVLTLIIIGALNWLLIGVFQFDLVAAIFGGQAGVVSRIIYVIIGLSGIWALTFYRIFDKALHRDEYPRKRESLNYEFGKDYSEAEKERKSKFDIDKDDRL